MSRLAAGAATLASQPETSARRMPQPATGRLLLTVEESGAALGVGRSLMYELIARGEIRTVRVGRLRRVRPEDLHDYVQSLSAPPG